MSTATIDADLFDVVTNPMDGGIVEFTYLSDSRVLDQVILDHYGAPDWLRVERSGGSPWTGPRGDVTVRAVDTRGEPVPGLSCDLGGEMVLTDGNGRCRFGYLRPSVYALELWAGSVGSRPVRYAEVPVEPGRSTTIAIVIQEP